MDNNKFSLAVLSFRWPWSYSSLRIGGSSIATSMVPNGLRSWCRCSTRASASSAPDPAVPAAGEEIKTKPSLVPKIWLALVLVLMTSGIIDADQLQKRDISISELGGQNRHGASIYFRARIEKAPEDN